VDCHRTKLLPAHWDGSRPWCDVEQRDWNEVRTTRICDWMESGKFCVPLMLRLHFVKSWNIMKSFLHQPLWTNQDSSSSDNCLHKSDTVPKISIVYARALKNPWFVNRKTRHTARHGV
jgi:hypothetical protein